MPHRHRGGETRLPRSARRNTVSPPAAGCDGVLGLQRLAGNQAVHQLLASTRHPDALLHELVVRNGRNTVYRYGTGEHAQLGSGRKVTVNGVEMTEGDLIALGDFFASPGDMFKASPDELRRLVDLIERDRRSVQGSQGDARVTADEWQSATGGRYVDLARANDAHFAPSTDPAVTAPADHKSEWQRLHRQALDSAHSSRKVTDEARAINGFASHFLTDAFAAGHLVAKAQVMDHARKKFEALKTSGLVFKENAFTQGVAQRVLADPTAGGKLAAKELKLLAWGDVTVERFSELLMKLQEREPATFYNIFAKLVHDRLNDAIRGGPDAGVEVSNARGDTWRLSGDDTLALSPRTKDIANAAVAESDHNVDLAAGTAGGLDYDQLFQKVWAYTPHPTANGQKLVDDTIDKYADPGNAETMDAAARFIVADLDVALAGLQARGLVRDKPPKKEKKAELEPGPLPGGGFLDSGGVVRKSFGEN